MPGHSISFYVKGTHQGHRIEFSDFKFFVFVRKYSDFAEIIAPLIHRKQVPLLHNMVLILCNEGAGLVAVILLDKIINGGTCILIYKHCG